MQEALPNKKQNHNLTSMYHLRNTPKPLPHDNPTQKHVALEKLPVENRQLIMDLPLFSASVASPDTSREKRLLSSVIWAFAHVRPKIYKKIHLR